MFMFALFLIKVLGESFESSLFNLSFVRCKSWSQQQLFVLKKVKMRSLNFLTNIKQCMWNNSMKTSVIEMQLQFLQSMSNLILSPRSFTCNCLSRNDFLNAPVQESRVIVSWLKLFKIDRNCLKLTKIV